MQQSSIRAAILKYTVLHILAYGDCAYGDLCGWVATGNEAAAADSCICKQSSYGCVGDVLGQYFFQRASHSGKTGRQPACGYRHRMLCMPGFFYLVSLSVRLRKFC